MISKSYNINDEFKDWIITYGNIYYDQNNIQSAVQLFKDESLKIGLNILLIWKILWKK